MSSFMPGLNNLHTLRDTPSASQPEVYKWPSGNCVAAESGDTKDWSFDFIYIFYNSLWASRLTYKRSLQRLMKDDWKPTRGNFILQE